MIGMDASTGAASTGRAHLAQSVRDILTTPIGSRIARRDYGSLLPELIDQPFNDLTRMRMFGAVVTALMRWEPRMQVSRVSLSPGASPGAFQLDLDYRPAVAAIPSTLSVALRFPIA